MNAVVIPAKKATAKRATPAPVDGARAKFANLSLLLYAAADEDHGEVYSGNSTRILRMAGDVASAAAQESWLGRSEIEVDAAHKAYDVAALVISAMRVPKDRINAKQYALLGQARTILVDLTEDDRILDDSLPADTVQSAEQDPRIAEVVAALERLGAMVDFAFEGRSEGDTGSTENNLLSLASDYLDSIADDLQSGYLLGDEDPARGHPELIHRLGRFEHLIEAIGVVIGARYPDSHREQARLDYIQQVLTKADEIYNECECGKWEDAIRNAKGAGDAA